MIRLALLTLLTACAHAPPATRHPVEVDAVALTGLSLAAAGLGLSFGADATDDPDPDTCAALRLHSAVAGSVGVALLTFDPAEPMWPAVTVDLTGCGLDLAPVDVSPKVDGAIVLLTAVVQRPVEWVRDEQQRQVLGSAVDQIRAIGLSVVGALRSGSLVVTVESAPMWSAVGVQP
jgi:hypothetical protein